MLWLFVLVLGLINSDGEGRVGWIFLDDWYIFFWGLWILWGNLLGLIGKLYGIVLIGT